VKKRLDASEGVFKSPLAMRASFISWWRDAMTFTWLEWPSENIRSGVV
jgi:hypothetical protein